MVNKNELIMRKEMTKIQKNLFKQLDNYKRFIRQCELDAPIEVLCLPKDILTILRKNRLFRVFDLADLDLTKIKGLGNVRIGILQSKLDNFLPI